MFKLWCEWGIRLTVSLFSLTIKIPKMRLKSLVFSCDYFLPFFKPGCPQLE